ncbi:MAG: hypothetical protein AB7P04_07855 [Bacteriovoracia bacterium]
MIAILALVIGLGALSPEARAYQLFRTSTDPALVDRLLLRCVANRPAFAVGVPSCEAAAKACASPYSAQAKDADDLALCTAILNPPAWTGALPAKSAVPANPRHLLRPAPQPVVGTESADDILKAWKQSKKTAYGENPRNWPAFIQTKVGSFRTDMTLAEMRKLLRALRDPFDKKHYFSPYYYLGDDQDLLTVLVLHGYFRVMSHRFETRDFKEIKKFREEIVAFLGDLERAPYLREWREMGAYDVVASGWLDEIDEALERERIRQAAEEHWRKDLSEWAKTDVLKKIYGLLLRDSGEQPAPQDVREAAGADLVAAIRTPGATLAARMVRVLRYRREHDPDLKTTAAFGDMQTVAAHVYGGAADVLLASAGVPKLERLRQAEALAQLATEFELERPLVGKDVRWHEPFLDTRAQLQAFAALLRTGD